MTTSTRSPQATRLRTRPAPYLRLKGDEVLFIFVVYFSIYYICYIHHWGQEKNRDGFAYMPSSEENKQTQEQRNVC